MYTNLFLQILPEPNCECNKKANRLQASHPLQLNNRSIVYLPRRQSIVNNAENNANPKGQNGPVHGLECRIDSDGPENEENNKGQVDAREHIVGRSPPPPDPPGSPDQAARVDVSRGQVRPLRPDRDPVLALLQPPVQQQRGGDQVGTEDARDADRDDPVESGAVPDVDERQHDGNDRGRDERVQRDRRPRAHLFERLPEGQGPVARKGPVQAGGGGHDRGGSADGHDDQDRRHDGGARLGARGVFKDGHEGVARVGGQGGLDVAQAVDEGEKHAEAERAVDEEAGHDGPGDDDFCVADFFGHLEE